ncbi:MAG TPA: hypothetical protein VIV27_03780 [Halioglobus sp.]
MNMQSDANKNNAESPVTEMAIVNTFTKLIFGDGSYTAKELMIIEAFRSVDANVLRDSPQEMGEYLRNLGVREMIQLVSRLRQHIKENIETLPSNSGPAAPSPSIDRSGQNRGTR